MAGDCFVAPLLAMTMMSGLVRQQPVLPHRVDDAQFLAGVDVPEGPAVAARRALHPRADLVDRSRGLALAIEAAVDAHLRLPAALRIGQHRSRRDQPAFDQSAERDARRSFRSHHRLHRALVERSEEHTSELQSLMRSSYAVFCLTKIKKNRQKQKRA